MAGTPARRIGWMSKAGGRLGEDLICPIKARPIDLLLLTNLRKLFNERIFGTYAVYRPCGPTEINKIAVRSWQLVEC